MAPEMVGKLSTQLSVTHSGLVHSVEHYHALREEISQFVPEPQSPDEALWVSYYRKYKTRWEDAQLAVILLSYALVEGIANLFLSLKADEEQFEELAGTALLDKWEVLPCLFISAYRFPKGSRLAADLRQLFDWRSAYASTLPDETPGSSASRQRGLPGTVADYDAFIDACICLPCRLLANLVHSDPGVEFLALIEDLGYLLTPTDGTVAITDPALLIDSSMYPE
jgi:hypothetical protein